jgi:hypothetical protein
VLAELKQCSISDVCESNNQCVLLTATACYNSVMILLRRKGRYDQRATSMVSALFMHTTCMKKLRMSCRMHLNAL